MWFLQFCEANLALLITLMTRAPDSSTRANIIISLGDMAARFPNTVEPWSEHMYAALKDKDTTTRKNALMVLSHLILNNMIKIKGPISDMALCLEDADPRIFELSRTFFQELATKVATPANARVRCARQRLCVCVCVFEQGESPIYNLLPEAISRLSVPEASMRTLTRTHVACRLSHAANLRANSPPAATLKPTPEVAAAAASPRDNDCRNRCPRRRSSVWPRF